MSILKMLGLGRDAKQTGAGDSDTVRRIVDALRHMEPAHARYVAAFAYILGRVAIADHVISEEETRLMERILMERGGLPEEQAIIAVQIARSQNELLGGTEDFLVTREFGAFATYEQKLALVDCLFAVSAVDGAIGLAEEHEIARTALELKVEHADVVRSRVAYREYLSVLKRNVT
jgi:uncharacterized tellurite resistance protein B-like protein